MVLSDTSVSKYHLTWKTETKIFTNYLKSDIIRHTTPLKLWINIRLIFITDIKTVQIVRKCTLGAGQARYKAVHAHCLTKALFIRCWSVRLFKAMGHLGPHCSRSCKRGVSHELAHLLLESLSLKYGMEGVEWNGQEVIICLISFCWFGMALLQERICSQWGSKFFPVRVPSKAILAYFSQWIEIPFEPIHIPVQVLNCAHQN